MRAHLFPLGLLGLAGCLNNFHTTVQGEAVVPASSPVQGSALATLPGFNNFGNLDFSQNPDFKNKNISKDQITSVHAAMVSLKVLDPSTQDFAFLDTLKVTAQTGDLSAVVAAKSGIPALGRHAPNPTLELDLTHAELKPFATAPQMSFWVEGSGRAPPQDTRLQATVELDVEFKVF